MKFLPVGLLVLILFLFYWFVGFDYLNWEAIERFQKEVLETSPFRAIFIFMAVYIVYIIGSMPGMVLLDVVSGVLFGQWLGFFIVSSSAVIGAMMVFFSVYYAFSGIQLKSKKHVIEHIREGFDRHATNYLLFLRLVPIMPYGLINIALGILKVRPSSFVWTTYVGNLPAAFCYTHAGAGISHILNRQGPITMGIFFNSYVVIALIGLSVLSIIPIFIKSPKK